LTAASLRVAVTDRESYRPRPQAGLDRRLVWSLIGALVLHVLIGVTSWLPSEGGHQAGGAEPSMSVRLLRTARPDAPRPYAQTGGEFGTTQAAERRDQPEALVPAAGLQSEAVSQDTRQASLSPAPRRAPTADEEDEEDGRVQTLYRPAETLSEPPRLPEGAAPVLSHPDEALPDGRAELRVALMISQAGQVDEVRVPPDRLPPRFVKAVQQAFLGQSFKPGRLDAHEVAARLCVAVRFQEGERPRWDLIPAGALMNADGPSGPGCEPEGSAR